MKYSVGWYTHPDGEVVVQITETLNRGWFADMYEAKAAVSQFFGERGLVFEVRRLK